jgi:hypothetical protein
LPNGIAYSLIKEPRIAIAYSATKEHQIAIAYLAIKERQIAIAYLATKIATNYQRLVSNIRMPNG